MKFSYQAEKLSVARRNLMLPHPTGEAASIAAAFHECHNAFHNIDREGLDDNSRQWVEKIEGLMGTNGLQDPNGVGTWHIKAEQLSVDEKRELSSAVNELAHWFDRAFWQDV
ncbi:hypothetical protein Undi14_00335 [Undibacterium sp. 14-3-2]|uniref:hypothetical protein n=1 Tax=Undibacterium sp. 14-3-2 TaxID=2800129 RepID=UPI001903DB1E|nr:hypothetical protein [Undibacterium sp. 14-3-2]MBK1888460.1 hypothetical protein [Undibacterium sp. 14-3-2]